MRARQGSEAAIAMLALREYPDAVEYLRDWLDEIHGRSGRDMNGVVPATYDTIRAWGAMKGVTPDWEEISALLVLDAVLCGESMPAVPTLGRGED